MSGRSRLNSVWFSAAIIGSVWASAEIVIGNFLHAVRFPFAGTILASFAAALLTAGMKLRKEPGVAWRAGLICALMKSVSPTSIIIGPLVGILTEALIMDASARIGRRTNISFILGGAVAVCMPMIQKIIIYIVTYGFNVAHLFTRMYGMVTKNIPSVSLGPEQAVLLFFGINALFGAAASAVGLIAARKSAGIKPSGASMNGSRRDYWSIGKSENQHYSLFIIPVHIVSGALLLFSLHLLPIWGSGLLLFGYAIFCVRKYPSIIRRFSRIQLWLEFVIISLLAGLFMGGSGSDGSGWGMAGLLIGVQMSTRAVVIVLMFSAVSIELRNPRIIEWSMKRGMGQVSLALDAAFGTLPALTELLSTNRSLLRRPVTLLATVLSEADFLLSGNHRELKQKPLVYIVTGEKGTGKTNCIKKLLEEINGSRFSIGGVYQPAVIENEKRCGYDVVLLPQDIRFPLCREKNASDGLTLGKFRFNEHTIALVRAKIIPPSSLYYDLFIIDEAGPLELEGGGWRFLFDDVLKSSTNIIIITVRRYLVEEFRKLMQANKFFVVVVESGDSSTMIENIKKRLEVPVVRR